MMPMDAPVHGPSRGHLRVRLTGRDWPGRALWARTVAASGGGDGAGVRHAHHGIARPAQPVVMALYERNSSVPYWSAT